MSSLPGYRYVVANQDDPHQALVSEFYNNIVLKEFARNELEDLDQWIRIIADGGISARYVLNIGILLRESDQAVVGGIVQELYRESRCGLVSYIAVHECMRGRGCAKFLMDQSFENLRALCQRLFHEEMHAMFIEVVQVRDSGYDHENSSYGEITPRTPASVTSTPPRSSNFKDAITSTEHMSSPAPRQPELSESYPPTTFDPAVRQRIWRKMGFVPLHFDLIHPGRMRGHRYTIAFWSVRHSADVSVGRFPVPVLLSFLQDFGHGVLEEEDAEDFSELKVYEQQLRGLQHVPCGSQYWV